MAHRFECRPWMALGLWVCLLVCLGVVWRGSAVSADQVASPLPPSRLTIATDPQPIIDLALTLGPDGEPSIAWLTRLSDDTVQLAVTSDPGWEVKRWSLPAPLVEVGQLTADWAQGPRFVWTQADDAATYRGAWEGAAAGLVPLDPVPGGAVLVEQRLGSTAAYVWQAEDGVHLRQASGEERALFPWKGAMDGLVASFWGDGAPVLAWRDSDAALWLWDGDEGPVRVSAASGSHQLVCSGVGCRLFWSEEGELRTAASGAWDAPVSTGVRPASGNAWASASDALGEFHLVWVADGELHHAIEEDWQASRTPLAVAETVTHLDLAIGPRGDVHALWVSPVSSAAFAVQYLAWDPRLAQARIVGPEADVCVYGSRRVYLETNLPVREVASVAFFLEASRDANDVVGGSLLRLPARQADDGVWSTELDGDVHGAPYRQRVVAQMRCADGEVRWAWGEWFTLAPAEAPLVWIEDDSRLVMYLPDHDAPLPDRLDIYLEPRLEGGIPTLVGGDWLRDLPRHYVGSVVPDVPGRYVRDLPVKQLADGAYVVRLWVEGRDGRYLLPTAPQVEIRSSGLPFVQVGTPVAEASASDELPFAAMAEDGDGEVDQVAFYLVPSPEAASRTALWLGTDYDGTDGWAVSARPGEAGLWYVRAEATDDDGRRNVAHSKEPMCLSSPVVPPVSFVTPRDGSVVRGTKTVRVLLEAMDVDLDRATLMLAAPHGCYEPLGIMIREGNEVRLAWDTRDLPDGVYRLAAVLEFADGHTTLVETETEVVNHPSGLRFAAPREGERVRGWQIVRLVPSAIGEPPQGLELYARDEDGELFPIGPAHASGEEWVATWSTQTLLDGSYDLVAYLDGIEVTRIEMPVVVANHTPTLSASWPDQDEPWSGEVEVSWTAKDPQWRPLAISMAYSPNGGRAWLPIATGLALSGTQAVDTAALPDSSQGLLRLEARHGEGPAATEIVSLDVRNVPDLPRLWLLTPQSGEMLGDSEIVAWESSGADRTGWQASLAYRQAGGDWLPLASELPATGSYRWDLAALLPDTTVELQVRLSDEDGREVTAAAKDLTLSANASPTLRLIAPGAGAVFENQVGVLWEADDPDGDPLRISIDYSDNAGLTWLPVAEDAQDTGYFEWYVAFLPPGRAYRVRVAVTDGQHVARAASGVFGIGPLPGPRVNLIAPVADQQICGHTVVRWQAEAVHAHALKASVLVRRAGDSGWQTLAANIPNDGLYVWDTTGLRDGYYELRVSANDGIHTATDVLSEPVRVWNGADVTPYVAITEPWASSPWFGIRELQWRLWSASREPMTATVLVREAGDTTWRPLATCAAEQERMLLDARQLGDVGAVDVALRVSSAEGTTQATMDGPLIVGHYEHMPPTLDFYLLPEHDLSPGDRVLAWQASGSGGKAVVTELWRTTEAGGRPDTIASGTSRGTYWFTNEEAAMDLGDALGVTASDGFFRAHAVPISAEALLPSKGSMLTLATSAPVAEQVVSGSITVTWSIAGSGQDAISVVLGVSSDGGQTWRRLAEVPAERGAHLWDSTRVPNGPCWLRLSLSLGEDVARIIPVVVQNEGGNAPVLSLTMPDADVPWVGPRWVTWVSRDADGDKLRVNLSYSVNGGRTWYVIARGLADTGSYLLDTSLLPNTDTVHLRITAFDGVFRTSAIGRAAIAVHDPGRPWVSLTAPRPGEMCSGLEEIEWVGHDPTSGDRVELRLELSDDGGATWQEIATELPLSGSVTWDTRAVPNGQAVLLRIVASEDGQVLALDTIDEPIYVRGNPNAPSLPFSLP
ncbi:MAG: hypothetical protein ACP5G7_01720 [Anaerolineae bacterium]